MVELRKLPPRTPRTTIVNSSSCLLAVLFGALVVGPAQGAEPPAASQRPGSTSAGRTGSTPLPDVSRGKQVSLEELLAFADANAPRLLDGVVGLVPVAGDAFDVMFRANVRNMRILKRWMDKQPRGA